LTHINKIGLFVDDKPKNNFHLSSQMDSM